MLIHVVSTGLNSPTKDLCIDSIRHQEFSTGIDWLAEHWGGHTYVEASCQVPRKNALENQMRVVKDFDPEDIVLLLDGDDSLAHSRVVEKVYDMHAAGAWVTYGSFTLPNGPCSWNPGAYSKDELRNPRQAPWRATHLKSVRAGLMQRLGHEEMYKGLTCGAWDMFVMFGAMEMAGPDRVTHCPEVLYVYNDANSFEAKANHSDRMALKLHEKAVRGMVPYDQRENLAA